MNHRKTSFQIAFEILGLFLSFAIAFLILSPYQALVSKEFFSFFFLCIFLTTTYFRWAWLIKNGLMGFFWTKLAIFLLQIPLFFFLIKSFQYYQQAFEAFNYTIDINGTQHIQQNIHYKTLDSLRSICYTSGTMVIIGLVLVELRIIYSIFKYREIPTSFIKNEG